MFASQIYSDAIRPSGSDKKPLRKPQLGFFDGFSNGWEDISTKIKSKKPLDNSEKKSTLCYEILPGGDVSMKTKRGDFSSRLLLEAKIWTENGIPPVSVNVAGSKVRMSAHILHDLVCQLLLSITMWMHNIF